MKGIEQNKKHLAVGVFTKKSNLTSRTQRYGEEIPFEVCWWEPE